MSNINSSMFTSVENAGTVTALVIPVEGNDQNSYCLILLFVRNHVNKGLNFGYMSSTGKSMEWHFL